MKRRLCAIAISSIFGLGVAIAAPQDNNAGAADNQNMARHKPDPDRQVRQLSKKLNLTADQQKQLLPILADRQQQIEGVRNDSSLSPDQRRAKMRSLREDTDGKIKAILTDTQRQSYDKMQQEQRERMRQRMGQQGSGSGDAANSAQPQ